MIIYVGVGKGPFRDAVRAAGHGQMVSIHAFRVPEAGRWAFDNGAYKDWIKKRPFSEALFLAKLAEVMTFQPCRRPDFAVVPDRVADPQSLSISVEWRKRLPDELRWYLAVQDGMSARDVDAALTVVRFDGIFVGGTTDWKLRTGGEWVGFAHQRRMPCHVGRVNPSRFSPRVRWALDIGADSVDGNGWQRDPKAYHWINLPEPEPKLW